MNGKRHMLSLAAAGATYGALHPAMPWLALPCGLIAGVGGLLPDLDHPRSIASTTIPVLSPVASFIARVVSLGKHRTTTHWLALWGVASYILVTAIAPTGTGHILAMALCIGYIGHLCEDGLTHDGVPVLLPWWRWRLPVLHFKSGGAVGERACVSLIVLACIGLVVLEYVPGAREAYAAFLTHAANGLSVAVDTQG